MARHSLPSFSNLWQKHKNLYIGIFIIALQRLSNGKADTTNEDMISERLCIILNEVCFEESKKNNYEIRTPDWEKPIQPVTDSELKGGQVRYRPDFTCKLSNPFAVSSDEHEISLHVECKRLGSPTSASWILNENYVVNGIKRFDCTTHEYGKRAFSGMMIGYIISMSHKEILDEVNINQKKHCSDNPPIKLKSIKTNVHQYIQQLSRKNLKPKMFDLVHLWVDLRER